METSAAHASDAVLHQERVMELLKLSKQINHKMQKLKIAGEELNMKDYTHLSNHLESEIEELLHLWRGFTEARTVFIAQAQALFNSADYPTELTAALTAQKIPFTGEFPSYDIPPFKLLIKLEQSLAKLSMGRKSQQTYSLSPKILAAWIAEHYKALVNSAFHHDRFCKELLSVYPYLSHGNWGVPVPIKEVYALLTIKTEMKQEYPESRFIFDLSRLLEQYEIKYNEYSFEFSPHKQTNRNYQVVNQYGKERAIGNMTIRKKAESPPDG